MSISVILPIYCNAYAGMITGSHYHHWKFADNDIKTTIMFGKKVLNYCLLLPRYAITKIESHKHHYTLISNNWTEIQPSGRLSLPSIPNLKG